jgi:hypothetical protein
MFNQEGVTGRRRNQSENQTENMDVFNGSEQGQGGPLDE